MFVGNTDTRIQAFKIRTKNFVCQSLAMNNLAYNKLYLPGLYKRTDPLSCEGSESDMYKL